ncbi:MAG TPA: thioredoxin domain-containing protein, partial [Tepidisphaeraceae bacterium]
MKSNFPTGSATSVALHYDTSVHTNRLINETSPYLLQHAHNPVDWYAWGPDAFAAARSQNKPIFLSVGYSTCYWCHVMERQSFENETIAAEMNKRFICIKVDREERPDVDQLYMLAVQVLTHHGGWPMSVFLLPDLRPFYGGTYFPPTDANGRPGFVTVMRAIEDAYHNRRG